MVGVAGPGGDRGDGSRLSDLKAAYARQQERYRDPSPPGLQRLEQGVQRRLQRIAHLRTVAEEAQAEAARLSAEVAGLERGIEALLGDTLEAWQRRHPEAWSPVGVPAFRAWTVTDRSVSGAVVVWREPRLVALCGKSPGGEVPHTDGRCSSPPCGIYAVKRIARLREFRFTDEWLAGLVGLSGKVVEHEDGYRAAAAEVVALVGIAGSDVYRTEDRTVLEDLFARPASRRRLERIPRPADVWGWMDGWFSEVMERRMGWTSVGSSG